MSNLIPNLIIFIILIFMDNNVIRKSKNLKKEKSIKDIKKKWDDIADSIFLISIITIMIKILNLNCSGIIFILPFIIIYILTVYLAIKNKNYAIKKINDRLEQSEEQSDEQSLKELKEFAINQMYDIVSKLHYVELDKIKEFTYNYKNLFETATTIAELTKYITQADANLEVLFDMDDLLREKVERKKANNKKNNTKYSYTVEGALKLFKLDKNASKEEVKAVYRKLVKIHHPDRGGIQDNFIKLNSAYEVLKEYYNI